MRVGKTVNLNVGAVAMAQLEVMALRNGQQLNELIVSLFEKKVASKKRCKVG